MVNVRVTVILTAHGKETERERDRKDIAAAQHSRFFPRFFLSPYSSAAQYTQCVPRKQRGDEMSGRQRKKKREKMKERKRNEKERLTVFLSQPLLHNGCGTSQRISGVTSSIADSNKTRRTERKRRYSTEEHPKVVNNGRFFRNRDKGRQTDSNRERQTEIREREKETVVSLRKEGVRQAPFVLSLRLLFICA